MAFNERLRFSAVSDRARRRWLRGDRGQLWLPPLRRRLLLSEPPVSAPEVGAPVERGQAPVPLLPLLQRQHHPRDPSRAGPHEGEAVPVPRVRQCLLAENYPGRAPADALWRAAVRVPGVRAGVRGGQSPRQAHAEAHGRAAVHLPGVREVFYEEGRAGSPRLRTLNFVRRKLRARRIGRPSVSHPVIGSLGVVLRREWGKAALLFPG